jgi:hypothetical protein
MSKAPRLIVAPGGMTMGKLEHRLTTLERRLTPPDTRLSWIDVHAAMMRQQARTRLKLCHRLEIEAHDHRVAEAISLLAGDDEVRIAQDEQLIARWHRQQGLTEDLVEIRQRFTKRIEAMARRLQAG